MRNRPYTEAERKLQKQYAKATRDADKFLRRVTLTKAQKVERQAKKEIRKAASKSKTQRRAWWYSLTPEQQNAYIEKLIAKKTENRINVMLKKGTKSKNCTNCLLGVGKHCDGYGSQHSCDDWFEIEEKNERSKA